MDLLIILTVYGILFLGELGDKTQLIVFNISLEHEKKYKVGIGATLGFGAIVTLGVVLGAVITNYIPINFISLFSGIVFVLIGIIDARNLKPLYVQYKELKKGEKITDEKDEELSSKSSKLRNNPYLAGFGFIFLMELGDKTQILTITLASIYGLPLEVWIGSFLALISLAWIGVFFGAIVAQRVPKFHLKVISVSIFIVIGIIVIITSI
jgi:putative Ca2+/H+ antiporter (TMEM165/GDT1 family)